MKNLYFRERLSDLQFVFLYKYQTVLNVTMLYSFNESSIFARGKNNLLFLPFEQALYQHEPAVVAKLLSHQLP